MIISLRGTSGAGKSHLVHEILRRLGGPTHVMKKPERRKPSCLLYVDLDGERIGPRPPLTRPLMIPGHYDILNGGADTLRDLDEVYELVRNYDDFGFDVIVEGKNMSDGAQRALQLRDERRRIEIVHLQTSLENCEAGVRSRGHTIARASITSTHAKVQRTCEILERHGVTVRRLTREMALDWVWRQLTEARGGQGRAPGAAGHEQPDQRGAAVRAVSVPSGVHRVSPPEDAPDEKAGGGKARVSRGVRQKEPAEQPVVGQRGRGAGGGRLERSTDRQTRAAARRRTKKGSRRS